MFELALIINISLFLFFLLSSYLHNPINVSDVCRMFKDLSICFATNDRNSQRISFQEKTNLLFSSIILIDNINEAYDCERMVFHRTP